MPSRTHPTGPPLSPSRYLRSLRSKGPKLRLLAAAQLRQALRLLVLELLGQLGDGVLLRSGARILADADAHGRLGLGGDDGHARRLGGPAGEVGVGADEEKRGAAEGDPDSFRPCVSDTCR